MALEAGVRVVTTQRQLTVVDGSYSYCEGKGVDAVPCSGESSLNMSVTFRIVRFKPHLFYSIYTCYRCMQASAGFLAKSGHF